MTHAAPAQQEHLPAGDPTLLELARAGSVWARIGFVILAIGVLIALLSLTVLRPGKPQGGGASARVDGTPSFKVDYARGLLKEAKAPAGSLLLVDKGDDPQGSRLWITPLQLATAYCALVNGGIWRPATLQKLDPGHVPAGHRVFKASTSARIRQLLRMIVVYGTGKKANAPGFRVGGKTGSAEVDQQRDLVDPWFIGFAPADNPRVAVAVVLNRIPGGQGGVDSAPIAKSMMQAALQ